MLPLSTVLPHRLSNLQNWYFLATSSALIAFLPIVFVCSKYLHCRVTVVGHKIIIVWNYFSFLLIFIKHNGCSDYCAMLLELEGLVRQSESARQSWIVSWYALRRPILRHCLHKLNEPLNIYRIAGSPVRLLIIYLQSMSQKLVFRVSFLCLLTL